MTLIAFTGNMGSGKSTAVETLKFLLPDRVKLVKFAAPLYEMQEFLYRRISAVHQRPEDFIKDRKLLQFLGHEWGRNSISYDLWVDLWKADAQKWLDKGYVVVCDDCRFDNEAETIGSMGGVVIKITSNRNFKNDGFNSHASEAGVKYAYVSEWIKNDNTKSDFQDQVLALYKKILPAITLQKYGDEALTKEK